MPHTIHPKEGFVPFSYLGEVWQLSKAAQAQLEAHTVLFFPSILNWAIILKKKKIVAKHKRK